MVTVSVQNNMIRFPLIYFAMCYSLLRPTKLFVHVSKETAIHVHVHIHVQFVHVVIVVSKGPFVITKNMILFPYIII